VLSRGIMFPGFALVDRLFGSIVGEGDWYFAAICPNRALEILNACRVSRNFSKH